MNEIHIDTMTGQLLRHAPRITLQNRVDKAIADMGTLWALHPANSPKKRYAPTEFESFIHRQRARARQGSQS